MSDALNNLDNNPAISGVTFGGSYTGQVYLGRQEFPGVKGTLRGKKVDTGKIYSDKTLTTQQAKALYLTDPAVENAWLQTLKKNGVDLTQDKIKARAMWDVSVDGASDWFATSNGTQKVTPEQYLGWYLGGQKKAPKPDLSRSVYQYAPEQIDADADEIAQKRLGRILNEEDRAADWYKNLVSAIGDMAAKGTVTTVKDVRNPKTGKLERITTQTPEFTKEKASAVIEEAIVTADPISLERKQNLELANWAFEKMRGRG
jgi:hypothetical protein